MTTYYVATNGSDGGDGSTSSPWRTISKAMEANLKPGDEVVVRPGTYNEAINLTKDGSAAANITLRSEVPGEALIRPPSGAWNAISVNANYITVDGFDIGGAKGDGIEANDVHHIKILNNTVHGSGESGIQFNWSDFITIEGNETYNNASNGWFSGISIYQNRNITGDTSTTEFRTIVRNNISHDNVTKTGAHTDGNGIIIDDFQSTQTNGHPNYTFPTLVENNLVYENGGKGIQVTWSDYVTVRNNTAYHNNQDALNDGTWRGELSNAMSSNNTWVNNIAVADPRLNDNNTAIDNTSTDGYKNANVVWSNNMTYNGTQGQSSVNNDGGNAMLSATNGNQLGVDPKFVNAGNGDFHLTSASTAIDSGTTKYGVAAVDLDGDGRVEGTIDIGSYETGSGAPTTPTEPTAPTNRAPGISAPNADTSVQAGQRISLAIGDGHFTDRDAATDLDYKITVDGKATIPTWLTFDPETGLLIADPTTAESGNHVIAVTASDGRLSSAADEFNFNVTNPAAALNLKGTKGNDNLIGDAGDDTINGKRGNDKLTGNDGADTFMFSQGRDQVLDFDPSEGDAIDLSSAKGIKNFTDLLANHVMDTDAGLRIVDKNGNSLFLKGDIDIDDLAVDMFLF